MPLAKRDDTHGGTRFAFPFCGIQRISATQQKSLIILPTNATYDWGRKTGKQKKNRKTIRKIVHNLRNSKTGFGPVVSQTEY
jgi:hypothetical protein